MKTTTNEEPETMQFTLKRDGNRNLTFEGELIGSASSQDNARMRGLERWSEIKIYRTQAGAFVVAGIGRTEVPDETDRCWARVAHTGDEVIEILTKRDEDDVTYLTRTAREVIRTAARHDERISEAIAAFRSDAESVA